MYVACRSLRIGLPFLGFKAQDNNKTNNNRPQIGNDKHMSPTLNQYTSHVINNFLLFFKISLTQHQFVVSQ
jgi:hypothetical protein